jgi:hypothetical protein
MLGYYSKEDKVMKRFFIGFWVLFSAGVLAGQETGTSARARLLVPLNSALIWSMDGDEGRNSADFDSLKIAKNPGDTSVSSEERPVSQGVYFGVPPKSASSVITLGVIGNDVDRFLSATAFQDVSYVSNFGYFAFDRDSFSVGVSGRFGNGMAAGLHYNGNIIEDIFAYISNNSLTNGKVGLGASDDGTSASYDFMGDLKDRNNINSRSNINLLFGFGNLGFVLGYSQKLFGLVKRSSPEPQPVKDNLQDAIVYNTLEAVLDNALAPHLEIGYAADTNLLTFRIALGFQLDIHQHRELSRGQTIMLPDYFTVSSGTYAVTDSTEKLMADYFEPAFALRLETDFLSDSFSQLGIAFETGVKTKLYSNFDDRGDTVNGVFWSQNTSFAAPYTNSVTKYTLDMEVLLRPSLRYVMSLLNRRLKIGLSGGFGIGMNFGARATETNTWTQGKTSYLQDDPADGDPTVIATLPGSDLGLYPNLGIGLMFAIIPDRFSINAGIGATQTLYRIKTGEIEMTSPAGITTKTPLLEQSWGKPLAQFAVGATFNFLKACSLDALFSSNGTSFDNANFVLQFHATF